jgi:class 3 adenylate cyclase
MAETVAPMHIQPRLLAPTSRSHRGRIVKTTGDGMLVEFVRACGQYEGGDELWNVNRPLFGLASKATSGGWRPIIAEVFRAAMRGT